MDSVVFVPSVASTEWLSGLFQDYSLAELPVAGRRIVDYVLEVAQKSGAMLVEVLDWHYTKRLEDYFNDPTRCKTQNGLRMEIKFARTTAEPDRGDKAVCRGFASSM